MAVQLNHTIVPARDPQASALFLAEILGRDAPGRFGPFWTVALDNGVTLDFLHAEAAIPIGHYAFLVSEAEFDTIFGRIRDGALPYWADPMHSRAFEINRNDGGRGVYWNAAPAPRLGSRRSTSASRGQVMLDRSSRNSQSQTVASTAVRQPHI